MAFGMVATARPQGRWNRSMEDCMPAAEPMAELLKKLPPSAAEKLLELVPALSLVTAVYLLAAPSLELEKQYATARSVAARQAREQGYAGNGIYPAGVAGNAGTTEATGINRAAFVLTDDPSRATGPGSVGPSNGISAPYEGFGTAPNNAST